MQNTINKFCYLFYIINCIFYNNRYNIRWYIAPIQIQKLILFLLQRGTIDFNVNVASLFIPSLEGFAIVKAYL